MAVADFSPSKEQLIMGMDNVVIRQYIAGVHGGAALDVSDETLPDILPAGYVIIYNADAGYAPMPLSASGSTEYGTLPTDYSYAGVLTSSILKSKPYASIMIRGEVNVDALEYGIPSDFEAAMPHIILTSDIIAQ